MQVLKDKVRENILDAAKAAFLENGYQKTSMRDIATASGITPGNIYRYFESKEAVFDAVVGETYDVLTELADVEFEVTDLLEDMTYLKWRDYFTESLADLTATHRSEMLILLDKAFDTKYRDLMMAFYGMLEIKVVSKIADYMLENGQVFDRVIFSNLITRGFISSVKEIITHYGTSDLDKMRAYFGIAFDMFFKDITTRFKHL